MFSITGLLLKFRLICILSGLVLLAPQPAYADPATTCVCADAECWGEQIKNYQKDALLCAFEAALTPVGLGGWGSCFVGLAKDAEQLGGYIVTCGSSLSSGNSSKAMMSCLLSNYTTAGIVVGCMDGKIPKKLGIFKSLIDCSVTVVGGVQLLADQTGCTVVECQAALQSALLVSAMAADSEIPCLNSAAALHGVPEMSFILRANQRRLCQMWCTIKAQQEQTLGGLCYDRCKMGCVAKYYEGVADHFLQGL